jgi:hypothetical protein
LDRGGSQLSHREELQFDPLELLVEVFAGHPNLPVT